MDVLYQHVVVLLDLLHELVEKSPFLDPVLQHHELRRIALSQDGVGVGVGVGLLLTDQALTHVRGQVVQLHVDILLSAGNVRVRRSSLLRGPLCDRCLQYGMPIRVGLKSAIQLLGHNREGKV